MRRVLDAPGDPSAQPARTVRDSLASDLEQGLLEVLRLVEEAVEDWQKMITRSEETIELLRDPARSAAAAGSEADLACELLGWLNANHFTFLGYREYDVTESTESGVAASRFVRAGNRPRHPARRLGPAGYLPCAAAAGRRARVDDHHQGQPQVPGTPAGLSRLHRLPHLRRRRHGSSVSGASSGLFSSSAYSESVGRVPVLRQKAAAVLAPLRL